MLIGLLDGCRRAPLRFWVGENQTHQICLITSLSPPRKQSSAFSNIEAILSIMAKVSLSRQMSRKYMLHIVLALAGGSKVHLYPGAAALPGRLLVGSNDREKGKAQSQKLGGERSFPFGLIMVMCFSN